MTSANISFWSADNRVIILSKSEGNFINNTNQGVNGIGIKYGDAKVVKISVKGVEDYENKGNQTMTLRVYSGLSGAGNYLGVKQVTIVEDDNRAYIGRRGYHPYGGGAWPSEPHCFTEGCAFD